MREGDGEWVDTARVYPPLSEIEGLATLVLEVMGSCLPRPRPKQQRAFWKGRLRVGRFNLAMTLATTPLARIVNNHERVLEVERKSKFTGHKLKTGGSAGYSM